MLSLSSPAPSYHTSDHFHLLYPLQQLDDPLLFSRRDPFFFLWPCAPLPTTYIIRPGPAITFPLLWFQQRKNYC